MSWYALARSSTSGLYQRRVRRILFRFRHIPCLTENSDSSSDREGDMASKDKAGSNVKKKAQHNLKEKRQAKKAKKGGK